MKKILLCLVCLLLAVSILASCGSAGPQMPDSAGDAQAESSKPEDTPAEPALLSADEANEIYTAWVAEHTELASYTLDTKSFEMYELSGEQYYLFHTNDDVSYWYNILIHTETGELLFMMSSDGENPTTSIEPLEDWYNSTYGE